LSDEDTKEYCSDTVRGTGLCLDDLPFNLYDNEVLDADEGEHENDEERSGAGDAEENWNNENADEEEAPVAEEPGGFVGGGSAPPTPQGPVKQGSRKTNEVKLPADMFESHVDEISAFRFLTDNGVSRSGSGAFLKQRMHSSLKRRSPFLLNQYIHKSVHLEETVVDCCRKGRLAYTSKRSQQTVFEIFQVRSVLRRPEGG